VLGGMGSLFGPLFGTVAFLLLEEVLSSWTEFWKIVFGPILVLVVLFARGGIDGAIMRGHTGKLLGGLGLFFIVYGIHLVYERDWLVPALIFVGAVALLGAVVWWEKRKRANAAEAVGGSRHD